MPVGNDHVGVDEALRPQATIARPGALAGRGLHTGRIACVRLLPAEVSTGIRFRRIDGRGDGVEIKADLAHCVERPLCTALEGRDGTLVRTIEHLMAALAALGLDNVLVEIAGEELPIFDGSAMPWHDALVDCGRLAQTVTRTRLEVRRRIEVTRGHQRAVLEPGDSGTLRICARIALKGFGALVWDGEVTPSSFRDEIAPSRSFGRLKWVLPLKAYAWATGQAILRGGTRHSAAPVWGATILGGARLPGEPVRHRVLDFIGDMALLGAPLAADVTLANPGHAFNQPRRRRGAAGT